MIRILVFCLVANLAFGSVQPYHVFEEGGRYGIKDSGGQVVVAATFEALGWSDGSFSVVESVTGFRSGNAWGLLHLKNNILHPAQFTELTLHGAYLNARKFTPEGWRSGILNLQGKTVIAFIYDHIRLHGMRAVVTVRKNGEIRQGILSLANETVLPVSYRSIIPVAKRQFAISNTDGLFELVDENGKRYYPGQVQAFRPLGNFTAFTEDNLEGLLNPEGEVMLTPAYEKIELNERGEIVTLAANQWMWLNQTGNASATLAARDIEPWGDVLLVARGNRMGLLNENRETVLPFEYEHLIPLSPGYLIAKKNQRSGVIRPSGDVVVSLIYDSIAGSFPALRARATQQNKKTWWLLNDKGNAVHTKLYDWIGPEHEGLFPVVSKGFWGLVSPVGNEVVNCVYDSILDVRGGQVLVKYRGRYGIIGLKDNWLVAPQQVPIWFADSCHFWVRDGKQLILKDYRGSWIYFTHNPVESGRSFFTEYLPDGSSKRINFRGQLIDRSEHLPTQTEFVMAESEGYRGIRRHGKYGFVDDLGRLRIANRYDSIGPFQEGKAPVKLIGKWGFISKADQLIIQPNFEKVQGFVNGRAQVRQKGKWGIIQENGVMLLPCHFDRLEERPNGYWLLVQNGALGLADPQLRIVVPPKFQAIDPIESGLLRVRQYDRWGVISMEGLAVIPIDFADLRYDAARKNFIGMKKGEWKTLTF